MKMNNTTILLRFVFVALLLGIFACNRWEKEVPEAAPASRTPSTLEKVKTVSQLSQALDAFIYSRDTLLSILGEQDSFTVFMPSNQAIADFLSQTPNYTSVADIGGNYAENLPRTGTAQLGNGRLVSLLRYHIIPSRVMFLPIDAIGKDSLKTGTYPTLRTGNSLRILADDPTNIRIVNSNTSSPFNDTVQIIATSSNIMGRNKVVVHTINKVLVPGGNINRNIQNLLQLYGYDSLYRILEIRPQIFNVLAGVQTGATFFAPSNLAVSKFMLTYNIPSIDSIPVFLWRRFRRTATDTVYTVAKGSNVLIEVLRMHLLADVTNAMTVQMLLERPQNEYAVFPLQQATTGLPPAPFLTIGNRNLNNLLVGDNNAKVTHPNLRASNGIIHAVDKVIVPPDFLQIR